MTQTDTTPVPPARVSAARNAAALKARDVFGRAACAPIEPAILQPAELFLDRSGEDIRRRLYLFNDPGGAELCLRPDLTIPACRHYLDSAGSNGGPARYTYCGLAFRYREDGGPSEFLQTGAEFFGHEDRAGADAEAVGLCIEAVRAAGLERFEIELGDLALFDALIDALDIPSAWAARLKRHFWRPDYFRELLRGLNGKSGDKDGGASAREGLFAALSAVEPERARVLIEDVLELAGIAPVGGRSVAEISERFLEQAAERASALPPPPSN
ncbi:MAG: ATP phosphoribosyltransferase regulatory subunit [Parvibaculaceae bacterium]|nr:ATP phosphoribosyltransferase regulatory subunit [Parvibaculaceae bacterium]